MHGQKVCRTLKLTSSGGGTDFCYRLTAGVDHSEVGRNVPELSAVDGFRKASGVFINSNHAGGRRVCQEHMIQEEGHFQRAPPGEHHQHNQGTIKSGSTR